MAVQEQKKTGMQDYYMFAVADQPYLKSQSVIKLIDKVLEMNRFSIYCQTAKVQNTAYSGSFSVTKPLTGQLPDGNR